MKTEKIANELCIEVYAMSNEETTMIIREIIGKKGVHETYMNIYNKLMNMEQGAKWEINLIRMRSLKSIYNNEIKEEEV